MSELFKHGRITGITKKRKVKQIRGILKDYPLARKYVVKPKKEGIFIEGLRKYGGKTITRKEMAQHIRRVKRNNKNEFTKPFGSREARAIRRALLVTTRKNTADRKKKNNSKQYKFISHKK